MTPKPLPEGCTKRKLTASDEMTADEEKAVAMANQEIREGKLEHSRMLGEYMRYLDKV